MSTYVYAWCACESQSLCVPLLTCAPIYLSKNGPAYGRIHLFPRLGSSRQIVAMSLGIKGSCCRPPLPRSVFLSPSLPRAPSPGVPFWLRDEEVLNSPEKCEEVTAAWPLPPQIPGHPLVGR